MNAPKPNVRDTLQAISKFMREGRPERAETMASTVQAAYPRRADVSNALGQVRLALGRFDQAETHLRKAVEIERRNPLYLTDLGRVLLQMGLVAEAQQYLRQALAIDPRQFAALWLLGTFYFHLGRGSLALEHLRDALKSAPAGAKPLIDLEIVECLLSMGETAGAAAEIDRQMPASPYHARLVTLRAGIGKPLVDSAEYAAVESELARRDIIASDRSNLMIRKGVMLENSGRFEESFATILAAKKLLKSASDIQAFARDVETRISLFTTEKLKLWGDIYGNPSQRLVFVAGLPRSGTTLTEQIIARHSEAAGIGELETMTYLAARMRKFGSLAGIEAAMAAQGSAGMHELAKIYEATVDALAPGKAIAVDKMPQNFRYIGELSILFPNARIIHCVRHPADSFLSAFQNEMNAGHGYSYDPQSYADYYKACRRLMDHWQNVLPDRMFTMTYEKLTAEPRPVIGALLHFLGLDWQEACLTPEQGGGTVRSFSRLQVRNAINTSSVGRWKNYETQLAGLIGLTETP